MADSYIIPTNAEGKSAKIKLVDLGDGTYAQAVAEPADAKPDATAGDATITAGGTAQDLFGGVTPPNGFWVFNNDPVEELWIRDSGTAAANGTGSIRVGPMMLYETPPGYKPVGAISWIAATTGHKIAGRYW